MSTLHIRSQKSKVRFFCFLFSALCSLFLTGCGREGEEVIEKERMPVYVKVAEVEKGTMRETLSFVGDIKAEDEVTIFPKVPGKIVEKLVREGDLAKKGDTLFLIDRDVVGFEFEKAPVESPIDGVVGRVYIDRGMSVTSQNPLALIINMDRVKIRVDVPERDLPKIVRGQNAEVRLDAYPEEVFKGEVFIVSPVVDIVLRRAPVEIAIDNPEHKLKPGMFARVKLITNKRQDVLIVPRDAVLVKDSQEIVYVVENSVAKIRKVQTGIVTKDSMEIVSGVEPQDRVIIGGHFGLKDGARVNVK